MNKRSHLHKKPDSSASNPVRSQFQSRPNIAQAKPQSSKPLTQTQTENGEFQQQKFEATKLELQAKYGTIMPEGQEQLTVLQAKMSGLLQRRLEQASSKGSNFANIPISHSDAPSQQVVQTKLTIGEPGDKYEQEADRVAAQVVKQIHAPVSQQAGQNLQREEVSEQEKELQMKPMLQLRAAVGGMTATTDLETGIQQARGGGQPLAANIRQPMEQAIGADFSKVKVHTDTQADQLNQSIQAKAFTTGQDVFFRQGEYNPGSRGGQELIAHELTHVVQQSGGAVQRSHSSGLPQKKEDVLRETEQKIRRMPSEKRRTFQGKKITLEAKAEKYSKAVDKVPDAGESYLAGFTMPVKIEESGGRSSVIPINERYFIRQYAQDKWTQIDVNGKSKTEKHKERDDGYGNPVTKKGDQSAKNNLNSWVDEPGWTSEGMLVSPAYIATYECNFRWEVKDKETGDKYLTPQASIKMTTAAPNAKKEQKINYEGFAQFKVEAEVPEEEAPAGQRRSKRLKSENANE